MNDATSMVVPVGTNDTLLWGMTSAERLRRIAAAQGLAIGARDAAPALLVDLGYAFDPAWLRIMAERPGCAVTRGGVPVIAHVTPAMPDPAMLTPIVQEEADIENHALRKRERPFMEPLTPATVPTLERASYLGSYKGVTDILTKYLWPQWAFHLTRLAARWGMSPNQITAIGAVFCILATVAFWFGFYWIGLACGLLMMVLDTVDGKLARCTITSSWWGNIFDHGIDLVHPPFWWYAWGVGLSGWGLALAPALFWQVMIAIVGGYVVQRLIEGIFMRRFGMHIHVWQKADSDFRLVTARRNPNMVILAAATVFARPDLGLIAVAWWTIFSLLFHAVRLVQAESRHRRGTAITSWLSTAS